MSLFALNWIRGKVMDNSLTYILIGIFVLIFAVILIPNFSQIQEKLGFETRASLKVDVAKVTEDKEAALESNKNLESSLITADEINAEVLKAINNKIIELDKADKAVDAIIKHKDKQIEKVKSQSKKEAQSSKAEEKAISSIQINALWSAYCDSDQDNTCSTNSNS